MLATLTSAHADRICQNETTASYSSRRRTSFFIRDILAKSGDCEASLDSDSDRDSTSIRSKSNRNTSLSDSVEIPDSPRREIGYQPKDLQTRTSYSVNNSPEFSPGNPSNKRNSISQPLLGMPSCCRECNISNSRKRFYSNEVSSSTMSLCSSPLSEDVARTSEDVNFKQPPREKILNPLAFSRDNFTESLRKHENKYPDDYPHKQLPLNELLISSRNVVEKERIKDVLTSSSVNMLDTAPEADRSFLNRDRIPLGCRKVESDEQRSSATQNMNSFKDVSDSPFTLGDVAVRDFTLSRLQLDRENVTNKVRETSLSQHRQVYPSLSINPVNQALIDFNLAYNLRAATSALTFQRLPLHIMGCRSFSDSAASLVQDPILPQTTSAVREAILQNLKSHLTQNYQVMNHHYGDLQWPRNVGFSRIYNPDNSVHSIQKCFSNGDEENVRNSLNRSDCASSSTIPPSPTYSDQSSVSPLSESRPTQLPAYLRSRIGGTSASENVGNGKTKKCRRSRTVFTELQMLGLEKRFEKQQYLSTPDRIELAELLGLSQLQVKTWYQNRRMKWKKQVLQGGGTEPPTKPKGRPRKVRTDLPPAPLPVSERKNN